MPETIYDYHVLRSIRHGVGTELDLGKATSDLAPHKSERSLGEVEETSIETLIRKRNNISLYQPLFISKK